jgi:Uma2 family endonuclease
MPITVEEDIFYPINDGNPLSDNTKQFDWIMLIKANLDVRFARRDDVFISGDMLWYPTRGDNKTRIAPDVMVVIGRPKGDRGSYQQWNEENVTPQIAFEILSPGNTAKEMNDKRLFYDVYGIEEYYQYNPDTNDLEIWTRQGSGDLVRVNDVQNFVSPLMQIRFKLTEDDLMIYHPDGEPFYTMLEVTQRADEAEQREEEARLRADEEKQLAEAAMRLANEEKQRADDATRLANQEKQRADQEKQRADEAKQRAEKLATKMRDLGINPDAL